MATMGSEKIDIAKFRKSRSLSQKELAEKLGVKQSFLSAIETGKSPLPSDKMHKLQDIYPDVDFNDYRPDTVNSGNIDNGTFRTDEPGSGGETKMLSELLNYFHSQAHKEQDKLNSTLTSQIDSLQAKNDKLLEKNDKLQEKCDNLLEKIELLREELFEVKSENIKLKSILIENRITF